MSRGVANVYPRRVFRDGDSHKIYGGAARFSKDFSSGHAPRNIFREGV